MANILHNYSQYQNQIHETDTIHETYSDFLTFTHTHLYVSMQVCRSRLLPPQSRLGSFISHFSQVIYYLRLKTFLIDTSDGGRGGQK